MPIVAVAVAAVADFAAAGAFGAVLAGTATLGETFAVIGAVGATIGAVGAVTHDKGLTTAGMIIGGIGGLGSLATSAGLIGSSDIANVAVTPENAGAASTLADNGYSASAAAFATGDTVAATAPDILSGITGPLDIPNVLPSDSLAAPVSGAVGGSDPVAQAIASGSVTPSGTSGTEIGGDTALNPASDNLASTAAAPPGAVQQQAQNLTAGPAGGAAPIATPSAPGNPTAAAPGAPAAPAAPSTFDKILDFSKTRGGGLIGMGLIQGAGSFLSGATSTLTPAQIAAYNAQAAANNASATQQAAQTKNMSQPIPTASRGIINSPANAVTGMAA